MTPYWEDDFVTVQRLRRTIAWLIEHQAVDWHDFQVYASSGDGRAGVETPLWVIEVLEDVDRDETLP